MSSASRDASQTTPEETSAIAAGSTLSTAPVCCAVAERQPRPALHPATIGQVAKNRVIVTDVCMSRVYRTRAGAKDAGSPSLKSLTLKARQP
jgi:hypothetical protein